MLQSFSDVLEPTLQESCYPALLELYSELRSLGWVRAVRSGALENTALRLNCLPATLLPAFSC